MKGLLLKGALLAVAAICWSAAEDVLGGTEDQAVLDVADDQAVLDVAEDSIQPMSHGSIINKCKGGKKKTVQLLGEGFLRRNTLDGVARIRSMDLVTEISSPGKCQRGDTFGFLATDLVVNGGCRGVFRLCVDPGRIEEVICESRYWRRGICDIPGLKKSDKIVSVVPRFTMSLNPCLPGSTFDVINGQLHVWLGCRVKAVIGIVRR